LSIIKFYEKPSGLSKITLGTFLINAESIITEKGGNKMLAILMSIIIGLGPQEGNPPGMGEQIEIEKEIGPGDLAMMPPHMGGIEALITNEELQEDIGLKKEQREQIRKIHFETQKKLVNLTKNRELKEIELRELLSEENPDMTKIENIVREISSLEAEIKLTRIRQLLELKKILTEEQLNKLRDRMRRFRRKMIKKRIMMH